jgi:MFS family permease
MSYRREEIARRLSFIYCCAALSGAFGGILAYGLTQVRSSVLRGWQVLYIVEGAITLAFAPIAYFLVPNRVDQSWFLTARQKDLCHTRLLINRRFYNPDEKFSWKEVKRGFFDWKTLIQ